MSVKKLQKVFWLIFSKFASTDIGRNPQFQAKHGYNANDHCIYFQNGCKAQLYIWNMTTIAFTTI